jgi:hypothetical protein
MSEKAGGQPSNVCTTVRAAEGATSLAGRGRIPGKQGVSGVSVAIHVTGVEVTVQVKAVPMAPLARRQRGDSIPVRREKSLRLNVADLTELIMKDDARLAVGRVYPVARGIGSSHESHHPLARDIANPFR